MVEDDSALKEPLDLPEDTTSHQHVPLPPPVEKKNRSKKVLVMFIVLIIIICLVIGAWFILKKPKSNNDTTASTGTASEASKTNEIPTSNGTKSYTNDVMRLTLTYPNKWTVTEKERSVWVESPDFSYETTDKGVVKGNFKIYIRQGAQTNDSKYIAKGVAIAPSEKLVYANPAPSQRKDTFLSSFGIDTTDNFAYFLIAGNFDLKKGDTLGPNYGKETDTFIIAGGYATKDLQDGLATNKVKPDTYQNTTAYKEAVDILKSIQIQ